MAFDPNSFTPTYNNSSKKEDTPVSGNKAPVFDPNNYKPVAASADTGFEKDWWSRFSSGVMDAVATFNYQVGSGARGVLQLATPSDSAFGKGLAELNAKEKVAAETARGNSPYAAFAGDVAGIGGDIVNKAALGAGIAAAAPASLVGALGAASQAAPRTAAIAGQIGQGAAYGASQFADTGADRLQNASIGGAVGGAGEAVAQGVKGGLSALVKKGISQENMAAAQNLLEKAHGSLGQVLGNNAIQKVEGMLAKIPVIGMKGNMEKQKEALEALTTSFEKKVGAVPTSAMATKAPEDIAGAAQYHIQQTADKLASQTTAKYSKFEQAAGKATDKIPIPAAQEQAKRLLAQQSSVFNLPGGDDIQKVAETLSGMKAIHPNLLQDANKFLNTAYEKTVKVSETSARDILAVKNALQADTGTFAEATGGKVAELYKSASNFAATQQMPFKNNAVVDQVLHGTLEPDKIMGSLIKPNQPELLRGIMKPMTPEGRGALRNGILTTLHEKAMKTGTFNPITYSSDLGKVMTTMKGALSKSQYEELKGLKKMYEMARPAQIEARKDTAYYNYIAATTAGAGMVMNPAMTLGAITSLSGLSHLLTSKPLGRMLIKLGKAGSTAEESTIRSSIARAVTKKIATKTATGSETSPADNNPPIDYILK